MITPTRERVDTMKNTYSYVDALNEVLTMALSDQCKDKLTALRDQVAKRNASKSDKPTKTQRENEGVKAEIMAVMSTEPRTITEIVGDLNGEYTAQKVMALVRQLIQAGKAERVELPKRKAGFKLVA